MVENPEENLAQQENAESNKEKFLSFLLGDEEFGLEILRVQEIKGWEKTTLLPNMPKYVKGVINLRGLIVPVVDLRERFNYENVAYVDSTVIVIVRIISTNGQEKLVGLVVDGVSDVYDFDMRELQPPPHFHDMMDSAYIKGLASVNEQLVVILDIDKMVDEAVMNPIQKQFEK